MVDLFARLRQVGEGRMLLGVGMSRGRKSASSLGINDVIDFWRVEDYRINERLLLRAEMKLPGRAWLEFRIEPRSGGGCRLHQRAVYWPRSFAGHAYWWSVAPFHAFVFPPMVRHIAERGEAIAAGMSASDTIRR